MPVAVTDIKHGNEDGSVTYIAANEEVKDLPDDVVADLILIGSVVESITADDRQRLLELEAEVEALRAELAAATVGNSSTAPNDALPTGAPAATNETGTDAGASAGTVGDKPVEETEPVEEPIEPVDEVPPAS